MFATYLIMGYCALALFGQGICFKQRIDTLPLPAPEKQPKYIVYLERKTWNNARNFCEQNNMTLAYIMTYEEQKDLRNFIVENNLLPQDEKSGYWLGAKAQDKIWRWDFNDENPRDNNFMAGWHWYKPNYEFKKNGVPGECMELQYINTSIFTRSLSWNNLWCDEKRGFVCQVIVPATKSASK